MAYMWNSRESFQKQALSLYCGTWRLNLDGQAGKMCAFNYLGISLALMNVRLILSAAHALY